MASSCPLRMTILSAAFFFLLAAAKQEAPRVDHLIGHGSLHGKSTVREDVVPMDKESLHARGQAAACAMCHLTARRFTRATAAPGSLAAARATAHSQTCDEVLPYFQDILAITSNNIKVHRIWRGRVKVADLKRICENMLEDYMSEILEAASNDEDMGNLCDGFRICSRSLRRDLRSAASRAWQRRQDRAVSPSPLTEADVILSAHRSDL
eukprot:TRINITY_DN3941_c0_g1_i4.p1 TRINITY_DN3941_c0_g1~~TRINITY_DN3941_c0_g1_i4.p1  ORF type:complete len:210 (+),score=34.65 TRINITY_DN3941_c0_g1_i4:274-903(+)